MQLKVRSDSLDIIKADLNKKYLKSGRRLAGSVDGNRIKLYTEDDYGKHSSFLSRVFKGEINGGELRGGFKLSVFVVVLFLVLFAVCIESIVLAVIMRHFESIIFPAVVVISEIAYFISIKYISKENDNLIIKYIEDLKSEDSNT